MKFQTFYKIFPDFSIFLAKNIENESKIIKNNQKLFYSFLVWPNSEFLEKNKNDNFLHGNIKVFTRVGLISAKNSLFWILNEFPVVFVHKMLIF
jgi:hypothetical protein